MTPVFETVITKPMWPITQITYNHYVIRLYLIWITFRNLLEWLFTPALCVIIRRLISWYSIIHLITLSGFLEWRFADMDDIRITYNPLSAELFIGIFTHLNLCLADAIHNFKWVKITYIYTLYLNICQFYALFSYKSYFYDNRTDILKTATDEIWTLAFTARVWTLDVRIWRL